MIARQQVLLNQGSHDCVLQGVCSRGKQLYKSYKQDWSAPLDWLEGHLNFQYFLCFFLIIVPDAYTS
ncbi:hypothetical protein Y1Q_0014932 [Alligator mississippiensis]|uniref:Uncharacterized protein n=1 Tax=Alligator mississippiensis TaxID=8496 RepID=A0A151N8I9_ALLMI|nr:hypothetical protein Y1Q_0014932 [Alligator mississippiensis]